MKAIEVKTFSVSPIGLIINDEYTIFIKFDKNEDFIDRLKWNLKVNKNQDTIKLYISNNEYPIYKMRKKCSCLEDIYVETYKLKIGKGMIKVMIDALNKDETIEDINTKSLNEVIEKETPVSTFKKVKLERDSKDVRYTNIIADDNLFPMWSSTAKDEDEEYLRYKNDMYMFVFDLMKTLTDAKQNPDKIYDFEVSDYYFTFTGKQILDLIQDVSTVNMQIMNEIVYYNKEDNCIIYKDEYRNDIYIDKVDNGILFSSIIPVREAIKILKYLINSNATVSTTIKMQTDNSCDEYMYTVWIKNNSIGINLELYRDFMKHELSHYMTSIPLKTAEKLLERLELIEGKECSGRTFCIRYRINNKSDNTYNIILGRPEDDVVKIAYSKTSTYPKMDTEYNRLLQVVVKSTRLVRWVEDSTKCILIINDCNAGTLTADNLLTLRFFNELEKIVTEKNTISHNIKFNGYDLLFYKDVAEELYNDIITYNLNCAYATPLAKFYTDNRVSAYMYYSAITDNVIFEKYYIDETASFSLKRNTFMNLLDNYLNYDNHIKISVREKVNDTEYYEVEFAPSEVKRDAYIVTIYTNNINMELENEIGPLDMDKIEEMYRTLSQYSELDNTTNDTRVYYVK